MFRNRQEPRKFGPKEERIPAWIGWTGLALYVAGWDLHPYTRTLSSGFAPCENGEPQGGRGAPHGRPGAIIIGLYVMAHLMRLLPIRWDILRNPNSLVVRTQRRLTEV